MADFNTNPVAQRYKKQLEARAIARNLRESREGRQERRPNGPLKKAMDIIKKGKSR